MKKVILFVLALINFGFGSFFTNAQTKVVEFVVASDWQVQNGRPDHALLVLDGNYGKLQYINFGGYQCMYDAYSTKDHNSNSIIKLTNPTLDWVPMVICLTPNGNYFKQDVADGDITKIRKMDVIPQSKWNSKMADYHVTGVLSNVNSSTNGSSSKTKESGKGTNAQTKLQIEDDGFKWYLVEENGYFAAKDRNGNTIIPLSRKYTFINYVQWEGDPPYFLIRGQYGDGACTITGTEVVAPKYPSLRYDGTFQYRNSIYEDFKSLGIKLNSQGTEAYSTSDGSGVGAVIAGAAIIGGIAAAVSSSSSGSSSSSNKSSGPEAGRKSYKNVEIVDVKHNDGTLLRAVSANVRVRNKNSYEVVVKVQCRFNDAKWDEGSYIKELTIPAGAIRTAEIIGPQNTDYYDARIVSVY